MEYGIAGRAPFYGGGHIAGTGGYVELLMESETPFVEDDGYMDWRSPILLANGEMGGNTFAVSASSIQDSTRQPWRAFDGTNSNPEQDCWHGQQTTTGWFAWYNPQPVAIEKFTVANRNDNSGIKDFILQYSDNNQDWFDLQSYTNSSGGYTVTEFTVDTLTFHKYWRFKISSGYSSYLVIGEITLSGKVLTTFYKDVNYYLLPTDIDQNKYYTIV